MREKCGFKRVFGSARKPLGNRSEFGACHDKQLTTARGEVILSETLLFCCFTNKMVLFASFFASFKTKQLI